MSEKRGLNSFMGEIMEKIYSNNKLCKLFYYIDDNPLGHSGNKEIHEWVGLLKNKKIIHTPFYMNITKEATVQMNLSFSNLRPIGNKVLLNGNVIFTILCHKNLWKIEEGWRTNEIIEELRTCLNDEKIGVSKLEYNVAREFGIAQSDYMGYTVTFDIKEFNKSNRKTL